MKFPLCSECFRNSGLQAEATKIGLRIGSKCGGCGSTNGSKLDRKRLEKLSVRFFEKGTIPHGVGGYASILQFNRVNGEDEVPLDNKTEHDWKLIKEHIGGRLWFHGPALWRIGMTEHYDKPNVVSDETISAIIPQLSIKTVPAGYQTFRIRKNIAPQNVLEPSEYGMPPPGVTIEHGRFDSPTLSLIYTSPSISVCLHECRVAITDDIFVATLEAQTPLRLADLTKDYDQHPATPFEDLKYFFSGICLSRETYEIARRIAAAIRNDPSVDGFIYDSFFTTVSQEPISQNVCFFPEAMNDGKLSIHSLNRIHLETVHYSYVFGPTFSTAYDEPLAGQPK